jgi:ribose transport system substrate-binding protein
MTKTRLTTAAVLAVSVLLSACTVGDGGSGDPAESAGAPVTKVLEKDAGGLDRYVPPEPLSSTIETRGPDGEVPVWYQDLALTPAEVQKVRAGKYRAAMVWHEASPFMNALSKGVEDTYKALGVQVVSKTSANFDQATLANNVRSVLALNPDVIITISIDPVADVATFKPAVDKGVKLVFASVKPQNYTAGKEYVSIVTYDLAGLGNATADAVGNDLGGNGTIAQIYYDANFYVTNQREKAFEKQLAAKYPDIEVVERAPMADPSKVEDVAAALIARHPDIKAIFAPWDTAAEGVVAAIRNAGRSDIGVYTIDLGNTNALDMAQGGVVKEMTSTLAVEFGNSLAIAGAYGVLGKQAPPMAIVPAFAVTKDNLAQGWESTFGVSLPKDIAAAQ